jgi:ABC-type branched-subunit amino acid transport system substrate-binding protein
MLVPARSVRRLACGVLGVVAALSACSPKVVAPPEPPDSVHRGDDAFRYQQYATAISAYRDYTSENERDAYTARAMYKTALAEYRLERYRETLATLDDLTQRYPKAQWVQVEALRGDAERALGNTMVALQDWEKAWTLANDRDRQKLRKRIVAAAQDLSDVDLAHARRMVTNEAFGALLDRQIVARQPPELSEPVPNAGEDSTLEGGEKVATAPSLTEEPTEPAPPVQPSKVTAPRLESSQPTAPVLEPREAPAPPNVLPAKPTELEPLAPPAGTEWAETPTLPPSKAAPVEAAPVQKKVALGSGQIGCLLPLSGPDRPLGERALRGVRLVFGADNSRLIVADTQSDPAGAARQFDQLARDPNVLAVIGPVRSEDAQLVAREAEQLHVPVLLLSSRDGLNGQFALQVGVTPGEEMSALLDYAMRKVRLRRFGLLYPNDAAEVTSAFRADVKQRGGTIVGTAAYPLGTQSLMSEAATVRKWRERDNLQAVFLPDNAEVAGQFANFLQREMPDVTLLGVHEWATLADPHSRLNGVLFADGFYADSVRPATRAFVTRFEQAFGEAPGLLEASAYDAATLAEGVLEKGTASPTEVLRTLRNLGPLRGAAGDLLVNAQGVSRSVFLLQVSGGRLEEIGEVLSRAPQDTFSTEPPPERIAITTAPAAEAPRMPPADEAQRDQLLDAAHKESAPLVGTTATRPAAVAAEAATNGAPSAAKVACLLPLSGPDHAYGKRALAGLRLAFVDAPDRLVVRDTGGDPTTAADWLAQLQDDSEVVAVVGPLRSSEAEVAAPIAERQQLPLLLLSQREGLAGHYVLQVAMTRTQEVRLLVHYAVSVLQLRRFGILYPNDGYGSAFAERFKKEATSQGASIVGTHSYPPGTTSFASAVVAARGWSHTGLDALFIPDAAQTATALAADVRSELPTVVLLGTESWNDARSLANAGTAIDGAVFADAFFVDSARPSTREFVERFQQRAGRAPTVFEAQAFDAGMALRKVIAGGATSRERIVAELSGLGTFLGAGELRAAPGGFERSVSLLRYREGKVEELPTAPTES